MGGARGTTACMNHQFTVASQAWGGDPQQPERHPLAQTKYDTFVMSAHCQEQPCVDILAPCFQSSADTKLITN